MPENPKQHRKNQRPTPVFVIRTLAIIGFVVWAGFYFISFISQAPELTDKFLIGFGVFMLGVLTLALLVWLVAKFFVKPKSE